MSDCSLCVCVCVGVFLRRWTARRVSWSSRVQRAFQRVSNGPGEPQPACRCHVFVNMYEMPESWECS
uniref:Putative secreted protein n=1 Tax=Anopheles darlingi TaxID=43151 RepID=A0A2M4DAI5_ANODA